MVRAPRMQLSPTTSAPRSSIRFAASPWPEAVAQLAFLVQSEGDDRRQLRPPDDVESDLRLAQPGDRLGDDEIDPRIGSPADLLLIHRPHLPRRVGVARLEHVGIADVAGDERVAFRRDLLGDGERLAVHGLEIVLAPDETELFAMRIIGERLDDVGAGSQKIAMQVLDLLGEIEHDLGHIGARLQIAAALQLEQVAFGADDGPRRKPLEQAVLRHRRWFLVGTRRSIAAPYLSRDGDHSMKASAMIGGNPTQAALIATRRSAAPIGGDVVFQQGPVASLHESS